MSSGRPDREIKVKFTTEHDGSGADAANKKLDETKTKSGEAAGGFTRLGKAATGFKGVMEKVNSAMAGFGVLALVGQVMKLVQAFADARKAHDDMVAAIGADNAAAGVKRLQAAYDALKESVALAGEEVKAARENMDLLIDAERRLQDAALARAEQDELAALDKADPLLKEKEADVAARYGQRRVDLAGRRGVEDVALQEAALEADAARLRKQIADRDAHIADLEAAAREYSGMAAAANARAGRNSQATDFFGRKGRHGIGWQRNQAEQAAMHADEFNKQASGALGGILQAEKDNAADRRAAEAAEKRRAALARQREAAAAEAGVGSASAARSAGSARDALGDAARRREREARDLEQARRDKADADAGKAGLEQRLSSAKAGSDKEDREAWVARNALEMHSANRPSDGGGRKWAEAQRALQAAYEREQAEAAGAAKALEALGEATARSMQALSAKASAAASKVKALEAKLNRDAYGDGGTGG